MLAPECFARPRRAAHAFQHPIKTHHTSLQGASPSKKNFFQKPLNISFEFYTIIYYIIFSNKYICVCFPVFVFALTSGLEVAHDMICSSIPDTHLLLSCVRFLKRPSPSRAAQFFKSEGHLYVLSLTISSASLSLATGSRSGTMKDSGKVCPRARASAVLTVVEKQ